MDLLSKGNYNSSTSLHLIYTHVVYNVTVTKTGSAHTVMFLFSNSLWFDWELHRALLDYGLFLNATLFLSEDFEMSHCFRAENRPKLLLTGH